MVRCEVIGDGVACGLVIMAACLLGFGFLVSSSIDESWRGWVAAIVLAELMCTITPVYAWFQTLAVTLRCSSSATTKVTVRTVTSRCARALHISP